MSDPVRHPRFLVDAEDYDASVREWTKLWEATDMFARDIAEWQSPWLDSSLRDGNPIFSAWSRPHKRGLRVIQHDDPETFVVWRDTFARGTADAVDELVIDTSLTAEHLELARDLIVDWLRGEATSPGIVRVRPPLEVHYRAPDAA